MNIELEHVSISDTQRGDYIVYSDYSKDAIVFSPVELLELAQWVETHKSILIKESKGEGEGE